MNHIGRIGAGIGGALVALACSAPDASATWGTDPVTVTSTTATIPLVKACSDGAHGTFVAWQEADVLRAHHVLPTGDLDPAWPVGGAVACGVLVGSICFGKRAQHSSPPASPRTAPSPAVGRHAGEHWMSSKRGLGGPK